MRLAFLTRRQISAAVASVVALGVGVLVWLTQPASLPSFKAARDSSISSEAYLLDRQGQVIQEQRLDFETRRLGWTSLADISPVLPAAVVQVEDWRFRQHAGVDWRAFAAAVAQKLKSGRERGASTLTMQLAGKLDASVAPKRGRRGVLLKLKQMRAARQLEASWSKAEILEAYLNLVSYRGEWEGIAAASWALFGKAPSGIDETEAWLLAALLAQPAAEPARAAARACMLARVNGKTLVCSELETLAAQALSGRREIARGANWAPHLARRLLRQPGQRVQSSVDGELQRFVVSALAQQVSELDARNVRDAAAVVVDNDSGEVLAYVGAVPGRSRAAQVDGARAPRQAGSTLKPFLYGLALGKRYLTAASLLNDAPVSLETGSGLYIPQNYEHDYKGLVSVRTALASSLNIPAVRTLVLTGLEPFREQLQALGYENIRQPGDYYGYSLALGSAEVSLLEQANAYRALARGGLWSPLRLTPDNTAGESRRAMSAQAAFVVSDILSDRGARAVTFGLESPLATRYWSAAKTGTSKDMRDNWCLGFTPRYTVGVWVGNFEGDSMKQVSGISGAAPAWLAIMDYLHHDQTHPAPTAPAGMLNTKVMFADRIEPSRTEWFLAGTELARVERAPPATLSARIESPANGMIVALDPDIPSSRQHLLFRASRNGAGLRFELNGKRLASANRDYLWPPLPGRQTLALLDAQGKAVDRVEFEVRATP
ncbi:MAG: penicillin-binding protein 1C [Nevskiales bacterium]